MKFFAAFINLVAVASAIDLYAHGSTDCSGNAGVCTNMPPNTCCVGSGGSVAARGIPIGWHVELRAYTGGGCRHLGPVIGSGGAVNWLCARGGFWTGSGYNFYGRKRDDSVEVDDSECIRPDTLLLADGSEYDLSVLNAEEFDILLVLPLPPKMAKQGSQMDLILTLFLPSYPQGLNATGPEEVPEQLKPLKK
ncbi:hypothetical protein HJFPF1_12296 [Paramyrothecium foliicola]|nr:hypothetical protein HJFPF1_12296 [Paramyrothecium foliicola]